MSAQTAREIRKLLCQKYPKTEFRVSGNKHRQAVYVFWNDGPAKVDIQKTLAAFDVDLSRHISDNFEKTYIKPWAQKRGLHEDSFFVSSGRLHFRDHFIDKEIARRHLTDLGDFIDSTTAADYEPYRYNHDGSKNLTVAESLDIVRSELKDKFPGVKFSVNKKHRAAIAWTDGPSEIDVKEAIKHLTCGVDESDGMTDYFNVRHVPIMYKEELIELDYG